MRVAIVGCGTVGPAAALLLAWDGHHVRILERVDRPRGVGAGILLQRLGQSVLDELGLAEALEYRCVPVRRVDARTRPALPITTNSYSSCSASPFRRRQSFSPAPVLTSAPPALPPALPGSHESQPAGGSTSATHSVIRRHRLAAGSESDPRLISGMARR